MGKRSGGRFARGRGERRDSRTTIDDTRSPTAASLPSSLTELGIHTCTSISAILELEIRLLLSRLILLPI